MPPPVGPAIPTCSPARILKLTFGKREPALRIAEAHILERELPFDRKRRRFRLRRGDRRLHHVDDVAEGAVIAARQGPAVIGLLDQWKQPLGAERQSAQHRDRLDHSAWLEAHRQSDQGDRYQAGRLDDVARGAGDELGRRLSAPVAAVEIAELGLEQGLGAVEDDVPDPAQPFLHGAGTLDHRSRKQFGIAPKPRPDEQADPDIGENHRDRGEARGPCVDPEQQGEHAQRDEGADQPLHRRLEQPEHHALHLLDRRQGLARVAPHLLGIRLAEHPAEDGGGHVVARRHDEALASPGQREAHAGRRPARPR